MTRAISSDELVRLAYGDFCSQVTTKASIESINEADLRGFHQAWFHPRNFVVAVSE